MAAFVRHIHSSIYQPLMDEFNNIGKSYNDNIANIYKSSNFLKIYSEFKIKFKKFGAQSSILYNHSKKWNNYCSIDFTLKERII